MLYSIFVHEVQLVSEGLRRRASESPCPKLDEPILNQYGTMTTMTAAGHSRMTERDKLPVIPFDGSTCQCETFQRWDG